MKRIGVLGGTRFIGFHLTRALARAGHEVTIFTRGVTPPPEPIPEIARVSGNRDSPDLVEAFLHRAFDIVFDLTAYAPEHVAPVVACKDAIGHYVFCSTSMVYRQPTTGPIAEDAPRSLSLGTYGGNKALAEEAVQDVSARTGWPVTIVRPHGVFGPFDAAQPGLLFARLTGSRPIVLNTRSEVRMNPVYVGDLINVFLRVAERTTRGERVYNVAGPDVVNQHELALRCSALLDVNADLRPLRAWRYRNIEIGLPWPDHDLVLSTDRIRSDLGVALTPLATGLAETLRWLLESPARLDGSVPRAERLIGAGGALSAWARGVLWADNATSKWRARRLVRLMRRQIHGRTSAS